MKKTDFVKRIQQKFRGQYRAEEIERLVIAVFEGVKEVIREGDELHINGFGRWYPKIMAARKVRGGWYQSDQREYNVPSKIKIGFSSFPATDRYVSSPKAKKQSDDVDELFELYCD